MTSRLEDEILRVRQKITESRNQFSSGQGAESNVVENIIRPILRSIGWTEEDNRILNEFDVKIRRKKGRADLVLSKGHNQYVLAIEAKKLGESVDGSTQAADKNIEQLIDYLISLDREFGILTDGENWHLIRRAGYDWETIWIKDIVNDDTEDLLLAFNYISPDNSEKLSNIVELEKRKEEVLIREWYKIIEDRDLQLKIFTDILMKQVKSKYQDVTIKTHEVSKFVKQKYGGLPQIQPTDDKDENIEFIDSTVDKDGQSKRISTPPPEGSKIRIGGTSSSWIRIQSSYREIVTVTAEWLASEGLLGEEALTKQSKLHPRRKPILVRTDNKQTAKKLMKKGAIRELRNIKGWFVDVNFRPWNCWVRAQDLLEMCGKDRDLIEANDVLMRDLLKKK